MRWVHLALILGILSGLLNAGDVFQPPDPEPTPEETLILEYMNRMRANPKADGQRIYDEVKASKLGWMGRGVDIEMFNKEMGEIKSAPPLVINLKLLESARKHSYYMQKNGLTHVEEPGKDGFVAKTFSERIAATGYGAGAGGENCFAAAPSVYGSHAGFVLDTGEGPGGMQPARGHRKNMSSPDYREVGAGALANGTRGFSVTHNFGNRNIRMAGGVMFTDKNGNSFYDVGEGVGGVKITCSDGASVTSWKSGAFTLELKGKEKVTLTAEFAGATFSKTFDAGTDNIKFDWIIPEKASTELADKLLQKVNGIANKQSSSYFNAVVELYMACGNLGLDSDRRARIDELTKEVGPKLAAAQKAVRDALNDFNAAKFPTLLQEQQKGFSSTPAGAWFTDAGTVGMQKAAFLNFQKSVEADKNLPPSQKTAFAKQLNECAKMVKTAEFSSMLTAMAAQVEATGKPKGPGRRER